jgi:hypothetical protein
MTREAPDLVLERFAYTPHGTFGRLALPPVGGRPGGLLYTVEDPPNENAAGASCIPEGFYRCAPRRFNKGGYDAVQVCGVPGRDLILFHVANTTRDVRGCIGVATSLGSTAGRWAVLDSRGGFARFMAAYGRQARPQGFGLLIRPFRPAGLSPDGTDLHRPTDLLLAAAGVADADELDGADELVV